MTLGGKQVHWLMRSIQGTNFETVWRSSKKSELLHVINKAYHEKSIEGNIFVGVGGSEQLKLFRHDFKTQNDGQQVKYDFFQVTARTISQMYPTASNSEAWREQNASNLLRPPRTRQHVDFTSSQIFCDDRGASSAVATNKKRKFVSTPGTTSADDDAAMSSVGTPPSLPRPPSSVSYWESGESRKLFAQKALHGMDCVVRKIALDRVEKLESINRYAAEWRTLVDGGDPDDLCLEEMMCLNKLLNGFFPSCCLGQVLRERPYVENV